MTNIEPGPDAPPGRPRRSRVRLGLLIGVVVVALLSFTWLGYQQLSQPDTPPAFYRPPAALPAGPAGTIIRSEPLKTTSAAEQAWRVLYTSTDPSGAPIAVSGVVVAPTQPPPPTGWPVIAWAHGTTGVDDRCAPSLESDGGMARVPDLAQLIAAGNVVTMTDYPGLGTPGIHPYLVGESEGRAVLDSIRAARTLLDGQASATAAVYGHSQGGHAALFAGQLAPSYAPELKLAGIAAMAPPTDLVQLFQRDEHEAAGILLTALALASWSTWYPDVHVDAVVHVLARPLVERISHRCIATTGEGIGDLPDLVALQVRFLSTDPATAPGWSARFQQNSPPAAALAMPLLVAQGLADTIVRPEVTAAYVKQVCAAGGNIELDTYAGASHFAVRTASAPRVVAWLVDRVQGKAPSGRLHHRGAVIAGPGPGRAPRRACVFPRTGQHHPKKVTPSYRFWALLMAMEHDDCNGRRP